MTDAPIPTDDDELLRAYLDSTLPFDEMIKVTVRLQADLQFRELFTDMATLRAMARAVPKTPRTGKDPGCVEVRKLFAAYRVGTASPQEIARISEHVAWCLACGAVYEFGKKNGPVADGGDGSDVGGDKPPV